MEYGIIEQYRGPYPENHIINISAKCCKIGFSLNEDDFMKWAQPDIQSNFYIEIARSTTTSASEEIQRIELGRTYIYQTDEMLNSDDNTTNSFSIHFPNGAPNSFKLDILYLKPPKQG